MKPRYYIATGLDNAPRAKELKAVLDAKGWHHTYDWTVHGSVQRDPEKIVDAAFAEMFGVYSAGVFIVLLPGGRGTHVELGAAIISKVVARALNDALQVARVMDDVRCADKKIAIYSENAEKDFGFGGETCAFYHHPAVDTRVTTWADLLAWIDLVDEQS